MVSTLPPTSEALYQETSARARDILREIVLSYIANGAPVGSKHLTDAVSLSSASIRNVMADLETLGLIYAPHTSAGRVPTDLGLRFFVDALLEFGSVSETDKKSLEADLLQKQRQMSFEDTVREASSVLSRLSIGAGLVAVSKKDVPLKHIEFVRLNEREALMVLVSQSGAVENRLIPLEKGLPASALQEASNWLNAHLQSHTLSSLKEQVEKEKDTLKNNLNAMTQHLIAQGLGVLGEGQAGEPLLLVHGRGHLLKDIQAEEDLRRMERLFFDLEQKETFLTLLQAAETAKGVKVFIGSENQLYSLSGSAVIAAPFKNAAQNIVGVVGVIGPTRLNYGRVVPLVNHTAEILQLMSERG